METTLFLAPDLCVQNVATKWGKYSKQTETDG